MTEICFTGPLNLVKQRMCHPVRQGHCVRQLVIVEDYFFLEIRSYLYHGSQTCYRVHIEIYKCDMTHCHLCGPGEGKTGIQTCTKCKDADHPMYAQSIFWVVVLHSIISNNSVSRL